MQCLRHWQSAEQTHTRIQWQPTQPFVRLLNDTSGSSMYSSRAPYRLHLALKTQTNDAHTVRQTVLLITLTTTIQARLVGRKGA